MKTAALILGLAVVFSTSAQENPPTEEALAQAMAQAKAMITPGEQHQWLKRFEGKWATETMITMPGAGDAAKGESEFTWLVPGRWLQQRSSGNLMGMTISSVSIMGYDNFKKSYVATTVSTMDTAMNSAEGDRTPDGNTLILYGTVDEYLTGEHDKMVKTVFRFVNDDSFVQEIHDLPIGETNTKVIEVRYTRVEE